MKHIWNIFRADWQRLTASVVAVVVMLGLCLVPCLYAWFNILSNWDPYGPDSTGNIKVAVASEDAGAELLGLHLNIGSLVLDGLKSNDQMGWVFVDDQETALEGVYAGDYYAALIVPEDFTDDFVSLLDGALEHPQIQYFENEKKNAIAPKITSKAKTAVQEEINSTIVEKVADALTTASSVFRALGLDSQDIADGLVEKLQDGRAQLGQLRDILLSLDDVMDNADGLLAAASVTVDDVNGVLVNAADTVSGIDSMISTGTDIADGASDDALAVLNAVDQSLADLEEKLRQWGTEEDPTLLQQALAQQIDDAISRLTTLKPLAPQLSSQIDAAVSALTQLRELVMAGIGTDVKDALLDQLAQARQNIRAAALQTNQNVNDYIHSKNDKALAALDAVRDLLRSGTGKLGELSGTLEGYAAALGQSQTTLAAGAALADTVSGYLAELEADVRRVTDSAAFREFCDMLDNDPDSLSDYLSSPVQLNTEIAYEIGDYGSAMAPFYTVLALFVGSLLASVMIKVPVTQPQFLEYRAVERYFGRFTLFFLVSMAQALVTAFGCLCFVGIQCVEPARFVLACCLCSLNFAMMNFALVYALDNIGMALAVIIMVLQVAGSGGSYPIHVLPALFQKLYAIMPFHYGMDMLRETVGGMYGRTYRNCALVLLGMCVVFTVFGLLVYYPARKLNAAIAESKERSGIM